MTRYPDSYTDLANCGDDGDTAAGFMEKRFKYEVQEKEPFAAFVCFGANDGASSLYPDGDDATKAQRISLAKDNLEKVIKGLQEEGVEDITLLTPVTYDDRENFDTSTSNRLGYSDATTLIAANVIALAEEYNLRVVDTNTVTTAIMEDAIEAGSTEEELFQTDRIHPNTRGHFVIASTIIETLYGEDSLVASIEISAEDADFYAENAEVSDLVVSDSGISYTYLANSLPLGVDDAGYKAVHEQYGEFVNFTESMNKEIIKITDLADGTYTVAFDGVAIGDYTAEELAEGINIAVNPLNPGQIAAKGVIDLLMANRPAMQRVRIFEIFENNLKRNSMFENTTLEQRLAWAEENETNYKTNILNYYPQKDNFVSLVNKIKKEAYALAQPVTHTVSVTMAAQ